MRTFTVVCPFCEYTYPLPENTDRVHQCQCGAVYKLALTSDMEDTVDELVKSFMRRGESLGSTSESAPLYHLVIYEDVQQLMKMKREYEAVKFLRPMQSFDLNQPREIGMVWLGSYRVKRLMAL
jgi:hypothetical protein